MMPSAISGLLIKTYGSISATTVNNVGRVSSELAKALAEIDYNGYITLESDCVYDQMPLDIVPYMAKYMCEAAKKLGRMVEDYKKELQK